MVTTRVSTGPGIPVGKGVLVDVGEPSDAAAGVPIGVTGGNGVGPGDFWEGAVGMPKVTRDGRVKQYNGF